MATSPSTAMLTQPPASFRPGDVLIISSQKRKELQHAKPFSIVSGPEICAAKTSWRPIDVISMLQAAEIAGTSVYFDGGEALREFKSDIAKIRTPLEETLRSKGLSFPLLAEIFAELDCVIGQELLQPDGPAR